MSDPGRKISLRLTYFVRLLFYIAIPIMLVYVGVSPASTAIIIAGGILLTWVADYFNGMTIWFAAHRGTLLVNLIVLAGICLYLYVQNAWGFSTVLLCLVILLALSSDAIANSRRWKLLLPAGVLAAAIIAVVRSKGYYEVEARVYPVIPFLAAMARLIFPRTKHLMHTSLDYPLIRVELLSLGMKRVAAVGIRRNKLRLPHEQTAQIS